jgi:hypothetical protein
MQTTRSASGTRRGFVARSTWALSGSTGLAPATDDTQLGEAVHQTTLPRAQSRTHHPGQPWPNS